MSSGSSARTVPAPTSTAWESARSPWRVAARRLAGDPLARPVGHRHHPVERGRDLGDDVGAPGRAVPQVGRQLARAPRTRLRPRRPRRPRRAAPRPPRRSPARRGRAAPTTTRDTPAATIASTHGGVRPTWAQGSSVTYMVAPAGPAPRPPRAPRPRRGARPAPAVWPSPTTAPRVDDDRADPRVRRRDARARARPTARAMAIGVGRRSSRRRRARNVRAAASGVVGAEDRATPPPARSPQRAPRPARSSGRCRRRPRCRPAVAPASTSRRASTTLPITSPMNDCPPKPGNTVMSRSRSTSPRNGATRRERRVGVRRQADAQAQVARVARAATPSTRPRRARCSRRRPPWRRPRGSGRARPS